MRPVSLGAALVLATPAWGGPTMVVEATVSEDLRGVRGTWSVEDADPAWTWVDPLADLPEPTGDRDWMRTFPGRPDEGTVVFDAERGVFRTDLPRRLGALGFNARGLFANGAWLPQPLSDEGLPTVTWQVRVTFPEGVTGVVGDVVGTGTLSWTGTAERVALAALPDASVTTLVHEDLTLQVVSHRPLQKRVERSLRVQLEALAPSLSAGEAAVVISPMRTRLARAGPGVLFLSDRAWRLSPGLRHFHDSPLRRGLVAALLDLPDPFTRDLVAAALTDEIETTGMRDTLKWVAWVPLVDQTLNDRSMPFATETLDDVVPDHPVRDDLAERFDPTWPGTAVVAQLDARYGAGASDEVGEALRDWTVLPEDRAAWLQTFDRPTPAQDYVLDVSDGTVWVVREAPDDAGVEAAVVEIGEGREVWITPEGPGHTSWDRATPGPVAFDPDRALPQTSQVGERYPARLVATFTGSAGNISLKPLALDGFATLNLRRADDSRTVFSPGVYFGDQVLAEARMSVVRMAGRPLDALTREHQVSAGPSVLWLDPRYAASASAEVASAAGAALGARYTWDTKGEALFPLQGHTVTVALEAGTLLTAPENWMLGQVRAAGVVALHPRVVLAGQVTAALSDSDFPHKELDLGSLEGMLSVPIGTVRGRTRGVARGELRFAPIRYASIPLLVLWGSELQAMSGLEAGLLQTDEETLRAVGATGGLGLVFDWAGAKPSMTGITAGWPVWTDGFAVERSPFPQLVVRAKQWF